MIGVEETNFNEISKQQLSNLSNYLHDWTAIYSSHYQAVETD
jgi:hypothetical protein